MFYRSYEVKLEVNNNGKFTYMWNFNNILLNKKLKT